VVLPREGQLLRVFIGEIVDTIGKIEAFMPVIDDAVREGLATLERVDIRFYRSGPETK